MARLTPPLVGAGYDFIVAESPAVVEATVRSRDGVDYLFLINHSETDAATVGLPRAGVELLSGAAVSGALALAPLGVAVVRLS